MLLGLVFSQTCTAKEPAIWRHMEPYGAILGTITDRSGTRKVFKKEWQTYVFEAKCMWPYGAKWLQPYGEKWLEPYGAKWLEKASRQSLVIWSQMAQEDLTKHRDRSVAIWSNMAGAKWLKQHG